MSNVKNNFSVLNTYICNNNKQQHDKMRRQIKLKKSKRKGKMQLKCIIMGQGVVNMYVSSALQQQQSPQVQKHLQ